MGYDVQITVKSDISSCKLLWSQIFHLLKCFWLISEYVWGGFKSKSRSQIIQQQVILEGYLFFCFSRYSHCRSRYTSGTANTTTETRWQNPRGGGRTFLGPFPMQSWGWGCAGPSWCLPATSSLSETWKRPLQPHLGNREGGSGAGWCGRGASPEWWPRCGRWCYKSGKRHSSSTRRDLFYSFFMDSQDRDN